MSEPRAKTAEEVKKELLDYIHNTVEYWAKQPDKTPQEKCDGLAFSILAIFDGVAIGLPALDIALAPHPLDKQDCIDQGEDWYEPGMVINNCMLHEEWFAKQD